MSGDTTIKKAGLSATATDEKDARFQEYMSAFRHAQEHPSPEADAKAQRAYRAYLDICSLYEQAQTGLNDLVIEKRRNT